MISTVVHDYFEKVAKGYSDFREKGMIGKLVASEKKAIISLLPDLNGKTVIDLGCGAGFYAKIASERGARVVGVDLSSSMVQRARKIVKDVIEASITTVSFQQAFDVALCCGSLEFIADQKGAIANVASLLKRNGLLIILYPERSFGSFLYYCYHRFLHRIFLTILSFEELHQLLVGTGFVMEERKSANFINFALRYRKQ
ncbi:class I SAM-dependent methyltransferase [Candidatus Margulisiibacteriota bacterium]